ncbi:hypothetical protein CTI12_AA070360 [Artemisia annua]|uniref:Uncharacterized protein n=1 Tax=Artemisia annua TaxID=35608 RepID=A0A2U1Q632_ARTAN|nr:hypothetical protein CTI12_AA070360 [Artemisia annua]
MDQWGDHAVHCSSEVGVKFRHNLVREVLVDMYSKVGIMVRKEAPMGCLTVAKTSPVGRRREKADVASNTKVAGSSYCA